MKSRKKTSVFWRKTGAKVIKKLASQTTLFRLFCGEGSTTNALFSASERRKND